MNERLSGGSLWLIGYRGSGKTTVGRLLAERWSLPCLDADDLIEERAGRTIAEIFAASGEGAFRDLESLIVKELAERSKAGFQSVISLGGGAILREENRAAIRGAGSVVWLQADAESLLSRIQSDAATAARRPDLTSAGGLAEIRSLLAIREPIYRQCADLEIEAGGRDPVSIADDIERQIRSADRQNGELSA